MKTQSKNEGLAEANRRAAERAREAGRKMQTETLKKFEQEKVESKTVAARK